MNRDLLTPLLVSSLWIALPGALFAVGCSDVAERPETAPVSLVLSSGGLPLEGVQLCQTDTDNCAVSDAGGAAAIAVPINQEISYTLEKKGYDAMLLADVVREDGRLTNWLFDGFEVETVTDLYQSVMSPYPRLGTGEIFIQQPDGSRLAGVTYELVDATGKRYYQEGSTAAGNLMWRLDLTATTANGGGGFLEVTPGTYEIEIGGATGGCTPTLSGWPGEADNRVRVPVRADHVTQVVIACSPPP